jgi:asparagine synthase (glutamine-hydrolysing)
MLAADCGAWLADNLLERGDRMTMAASVELRPPFLDHRLVELGFSLPDAMKVRDGRGKWVLRQIAQRRLPASVVERPKAGFPVPLGQWFREDLRDVAHDLLLSPSSFVGEVFDRRAIARLLARHDRGRSDEDIRIWTLVSLEVWHEVAIRSRRRDVREAVPA